MLRQVKFKVSRYLSVSLAIHAIQGEGHIYTYTFREGSIERSGAYYLGELVTQVRPGMRTDVVDTVVLTVTDGI